MNRNHQSKPASQYLTDVAPKLFRYIPILYFDRKLMKAVESKSQLATRVVPRLARQSLADIGNAGGVSIA
jgi:hypothetical protein